MTKVKTSWNAWHVNSMCISHSYCYFSVIKKQRDRKVAGEQQKSLSACRNQSLLLKLGCDPGFRPSLGMIPWRPHCMPRLSKPGINQSSGGAAHDIHRGKLVVQGSRVGGYKKKKAHFRPNQLAVLRNLRVGADFFLCLVVLGSEKAAQPPLLTHRSFLDQAGSNILGLS